MMSAIIIYNICQYVYTFVFSLKKPDLSYVVVGNKSNSIGYYNHSLSIWVWVCKKLILLFLHFRDKLFPESVVRNIIYQVLQGLAFMHKHGR